MATLPPKQQQQQQDLDGEAEQLADQVSSVLSPSIMYAFAKNKKNNDNKIEQIKKHKEKTSADGDADALPSEMNKDAPVPPKLSKLLPPEVIAAMSSDGGGIATQRKKIVIHSSEEEEKDIHEDNNEDKKRRGRRRRDQERRRGGKSPLRSKTDRSLSPHKGTTRRPMRADKEKPNLSPNTKQKQQYEIQKLKQRIKNHAEEVAIDLENDKSKSENNDKHKLVDSNSERKKKGSRKPKGHVRECKSRSRDGAEGGGRHGRSGGRRNRGGGARTNIQQEQLLQAATAEHESFREEDFATDSTSSSELERNLSQKEKEEGVDANDAQQKGSYNFLKKIAQGATAATATAATATATNGTSVLVNATSIAKGAGEATMNAAASTLVSIQNTAASQRSLNLKLPSVRNMMGVSSSGPVKLNGNDTSEDEDQVAAEGKKSDNGETWGFGGDF